MHVEVTSAAAEAQASRPHRSTWPMPVTSMAAPPSSGTCTDATPGSSNTRIYTHVSLQKANIPMHCSRKIAGGHAVLMEKLERELQSFQKDAAQYVILEPSFTECQACLACVSHSVLTRRPKTISRR